MKEELSKHHNKKIVFFDGVCNFCNGTVDWIWKYNNDENLYFSSLQSDFASMFLGNFNIKNIELNTIYFYDNGKVKERSKAVLSIMTYLKNPWKWIGSFLLIIPSFFSDFFYTIMAKVRYKIAGKRDTCRLPTKEERSRFLE